MDKYKISVITVCYNSAETIEKTILSVLSQTYPYVEYIIIDGGSTDGTVDFIKKYADRIDYWVSEPDNGIFHAMNKGIEAATGDYINFMNSGDFFVHEETLKEAVMKFDVSSEIIYGDSYSYTSDPETKTFRKASEQINKLSKDCIYRHGSSFVKTTLHKKNLFDTDKVPLIGFALDYDLIYRFYMSSCNFQYINIPIMNYAEKGISNDTALCLKYNYLITHNYKEPGLIDTLILKLKLIKSRLRIRTRLERLIRKQ